MKKFRWTALLLAAALMLPAAVPAYAAEAEESESAAVEETTAESDHWDGAKYIRDGKAVKGLQEIEGKTYYFKKSGKLVKNQLVYKIGKKYYSIDKKGVATAFSGVEAKAAARVYILNKKKAVTPKKAASVFKKAFLWSAKLKYADNTKKGLSGKKALKYYGKYGFDKKRGDCGTQAATFVYMARVLGCKAKMVQGTVPTAVTASGKPAKFRTHAWAEVKLGKKGYVFDPNFNHSSDAAALRKKNKYVGYKFVYGAKNTYRYYTSKHKLIKKTSVK